MACKKTHTSSSYGNISFNYHGKIISGECQAPFSTTYRGATWIGTQGNLGTGSFDFAFYYDNTSSVDSLKSNILYTTGSGYSSEISTLILQFANTDSSSFDFTSINNGMASGTFYARGHISYPNGTVGNDSITNGVFT